MRIANLNLNEAPTYNRTVDNLLASGWISGWQRPVYEAAATVSVRVRNDDRPSVRFGALVPQMASSSKYETRYGQTECELRGLILGLITAGFYPRVVAVGDAPDGLVAFDEGDVWVEFAEVVDAPSARYTNMMANLTRDIQDDIDRNAQANFALKGHHLEFRLEVCPSKTDARGVRQELLDFIRSRSHAEIPPRTMVALTSGSLQRMQTHLYRADWPHGATGGSPHVLHIQAAAHSFSPLSLAAIVYRRLLRKRHSGTRYGVQPLWLVLGVTDIRGVWDESLALLSRSCPAIDPYHRVIVHDGHCAITWGNGSVTVRDVYTAIQTG